METSSHKSNSLKCSSNFGILNVISSSHYFIVSSFFHNTNEVVFGNQSSEQFNRTLLQVNWKSVNLQKHTCIYYVVTNRLRTKILTIYSNEHGCRFELNILCVVPVVG